MPGRVIIGTAGCIGLVSCTSGISGSATVNGTPYTFGASRVPRGSTTGETTPPEESGSTTPAIDYEETAEYPANVFNTLNVGAVAISRTVAGQTYTIKCRIPPNSGQPGSVRDGGWYDMYLPGESGETGWVAANTFENGPQPNQIPYDSNVAPCSI